MHFLLEVTVRKGEAVVAGTSCPVTQRRESEAQKAQQTLPRSHSLRARTCPGAQLSRLQAHCPTQNSPLQDFLDLQECKVQLRQARPSPANHGFSPTLTSLTPPPPSLPVHTPGHTCPQAPAIPPPKPLKLNFQKKGPYWLFKRESSPLPGVARPGSGCPLVTAVPRDRLEPQVRAWAFLGSWPAGLLPASACS